MNVPFLRLSVGTPITLYLSALASFSTGTVDACGQIQVRRPR